MLVGRVFREDSAPIVFVSHDEWAILVAHPILFVPRVRVPPVQ